jgi:carboxyl-terminal processing protease
MLPRAVGYIGLRIFGERAGEEVRAAALRLDAQGAQALVFDLRNDGGGYESAAVKVADDFIASGPIVAVAENHGKRHVTLADGKALPPRPLVVLVNHDSASGSELVAGALQDRGLARLVGTRTFGKGLVQTMIPLPDGSALKVTTARYFTAGGRDIDRVGVMPDVSVDEPSDAQLGVPGHDPQLDRALALLVPK